MKPTWHLPFNGRKDERAGQRILPLYDADAGPADGVLQREAQQRPRRPRGRRRRLLFGLGRVVLPLSLRGAGRGDGPAPS